MGIGEGRVEVGSGHPSICDLRNARHDLRSRNAKPVYVTSDGRLGDANLLSEVLLLAAIFTKVIIERHHAMKTDLA